MNKCELIDERKAALVLSDAARVLILAHMKPDGDTLGSAFAMAHALAALGKSAVVRCSDEITPRYDMMFGSLPVDGGPEDFEADFVLAVDVSDTQLLGKRNDKWSDKIDLCIDHHPSNSRYAKRLLLDDRAAATTEIISRVIGELGVELTPVIADCLYTGLATDTGCFRYSNVTPFTHRLAARLIEGGAQHYLINKRMFETKSVARMAVERMVMDTLEYDFDKRYSSIVISAAAVEASGANDDDLEGISTLPRQIEGVDVCATFREKGENLYRVSMRGGPLVNVSELCMSFGGGGHPRAAGCMIAAPLEQAKKRLALHVGRALGYSGSELAKYEESSGEVGKNA